MQMNAIFVTQMPLASTRQAHILASARQVSAVTGMTAVI